MISAVRRGRGVALMSVTCVVCAAIAAALVAMIPARAASPHRWQSVDVESRLPIVQRQRMAACVQVASWSPAAGPPCPPAPYRPGDFVYTCAWIDSHPVDAAEARVSCETR